jgi:hypothetical protein
MKELIFEIEQNNTLYQGPTRNESSLMVHLYEDSYIQELYYIRIARGMCHRNNGLYSFSEIFQFQKLLYIYDITLVIQDATSETRMDVHAACLRSLFRSVFAPSFCSSAKDACGMQCFL